MEDLEVFWGRLVLELRARIGLNKGYAVRKLAQDHNLASVIFMGDDITDLDGLRALRDLVAGGVLEGMGIVVTHLDSPDRLLEAADYALRGVPEVEAFLKWLDTAAANPSP